MIHPAQSQLALEALHRAIVHVRFLAMQGAAHEDIADALDWIELLPTLIAAPSDKTVQFRETLEALVERLPACSSALAVFDRREPVKA